MQGARARGLDPAAVLAVASREGLSGGIGDGGHAYGPFQLNNAGGVITGSHPGTNDQRIQTWASSPAGINYALDKIAGVARGLHGRQAVNAIVSQFERPADPAGEIAGALSAYGRYQNLGSGRATPPGPAVEPGVSAGARTFAGPTPAVNTFSPITQQVIASNDALLGVAPPRFDLLQQSPAQPQPVGRPQSVQAPYKTQAPVKGKTLKAIEGFAAPYGLSITSTTGGKHAKGSYHYRGRAVDFGGDPRKMSALATAALHTGGWQEFIYTGPGNPGYSILEGRTIPNSALPKALYAQHTNHVHLAR